MAFNFGGFLAGMSETIVSSIEEEEAQQRRFDLLAETDAMKQRNARKAERDKKQAVLEESAKYLESLGYDEDSIAHIAKQGNLAVLKMLLPTVDLHVKKIWTLIQYTSWKVCVTLVTLKK
jgi:hypothetical protein